MNIGLYYDLSNDTSLIPWFYLLTNGSVDLINGIVDYNSLQVPTKFKVIEGDNIYHFSTDIQELEYCDVKVMNTAFNGNFYKDRILEAKDRFDYIVLSHANGEGLGPSYIPIIKELLEIPNLIFISGQNFTDLDSHPRLITDPFLTLYFFYNGFGYHFLNYYPATEKKHLIGVYNRHNIYKPHRAQSIDYFREKINAEITVFEPATVFETALTGPILSRWSWQSMHVTTYLDYNVCAANIVFETSDGYQTHSVFTEKTLKSIMFQQADIFFIYAGNIQGIDWLHEKGFWFLNSEFYNDNRDCELDPVIFHPNGYKLFRSVYKSIEYLKTLKDELKTDTDVYNFLLNKHRDKIDNNVRIFQNLLRNCEYKERLITLITE